MIIYDIHHCQQTLIDQNFSTRSLWHPFSFFLFPFLSQYAISFYIESPLNCNYGLKNQDSLHLFKVPLSLSESQTQEQVSLPYTPTTRSDTCRSKHHLDKTHSEHPENIYSRVLLMTHIVSCSSSIVTYDNFLSMPYIFMRSNKKWKEVSPYFHFLITMNQPCSVFT